MTFFHVYLVGFLVTAILLALRANKVDDKGIDEEYKAVFRIMILSILFMAALLWPVTITTMVISGIVKKLMEM